MNISLKYFLPLLSSTAKFVGHDLDTGLHTDTLSMADEDAEFFRFQIRTILNKFVRNIYIPHPNTDGVLHIDVAKEGGAA